MGGGRRFVAIHLDQDKPGWVIALLNQIKPRDAGFPDALARIFNRCFAERLDEPCFDVNVDKDNEHAAEHPPCAAVAQALRSLLN